jgi:hypothetical protein
MEESLMHYSKKYWPEVLKVLDLEKEVLLSANDVINLRIRRYGRL